MLVGSATSRQSSTTCSLHPNWVRPCGQQMPSFHLFLAITARYVCACVNAPLNYLCRGSMCLCPGRPAWRLRASAVTHVTAIPRPTAAACLSRAAIMRCRCKEEAGTEFAVIGRLHDCTTREGEELLTSSAPRIGPNSPAPVTECCPRNPSCKEGVLGYSSRSSPSPRKPA